MKFCSECGSKVSLRIPEGDDKERFVCDQCGYIVYQNPKVLVALFLYHRKKLFWAKRGIEPNKGLWAFPAGFVECGESLRQAAVRELFEETGIVISPEALIPMSLASAMDVDQIYIVFRCPCEYELEAKLTPETQAWAWLEESDAPWSNMAHCETEQQVRQVYRWLDTGEFGMRVGEVSRTGGKYHVFPLR